MMRPVATMLRCAADPDTPVFCIARFETTFKQLWDVVDTRAARKPKVSKAGELHEAAAMPNAMGIKQKRAMLLGRVVIPSSIAVRKTVISGMPWGHNFVRKVPFVMAPLTTFRSVSQGYPNTLQSDTVNVIMCEKLVLVLLTICLDYVSVVVSAL